MQIDMIAMDLDGTILNNESHLSPYMRRALDYAVSRGVHLVISSGRPFEALPEEVTGIDGIEYAIVSNGAAVYRISTGEAIRSLTIDPAAVQKVLGLARDAGLFVETFIAGRPYAQADYLADPAKFGAAPKRISYLQRTRHPVQDIFAFTEAHAHELESLDIVVRSKDSRASIWHAAAQIPNVYVTSSTMSLVEVSAAGSGKGNAVRWLADTLHVSRRNVVSCGNAENDIDMLEAAGIAVAVANSPASVQSSADFVVPSNEDDGVGHFIYEHIPAAGAQS